MRAWPCRYYLLGDAGDALVCVVCVEMEGPCPVLRLVCHEERTVTQLCRELIFELAQAFECDVFGVALFGLLCER